MAMYVSITHCPNTLCTLNVGVHAQFYIKKGYYYTQHNRQQVPRYQCKACKKELRPVAISVRLSKTAVEYLKKLADAHNMSQADVIEYLLKAEWKVFQGNKK